MTQPDVLYTVETGTSATTIRKMLRVLFPDVVTVLDMTYGSGMFWKPEPPEGITLTRMDADPSRAPDYAGDFTALPWEDGSFDLAIFDPPYHTDRGRGKSSITAERFGHYPTLDDLKQAIEAGCREAWRVSRIGVIVKVQDYIHGSKYIELTEWVERTIMTRWTRDAIGQAPYQRIDQMRPGKIVDPKWNAAEQLSAWSNSATFLAFRHGRQEHKRRTPAETTPALVHKPTPIYAPLIEQRRRRVTGVRL